LAQRRKPHFVIITGLSGAGKNQALRCLEDLGFFCVDNLPTSLLITFAQLCCDSSNPIEKIALGIDIRERIFLDKLLGTLTLLKSSGFIYQILYLEASNKVLIRRFSETRRRHPLGAEDSIVENIEIEKKRLAPIKRKADLIIDTTNLNVHELKERLIKNFLAPPHKVKMMINIISFGYKFGLPEYADLIFDVRFLPNPYYIRRFRSSTGRAKAVRTFVLKEKVTSDFLTRLYTLLDFLMPYYRCEGKAYLTVALGCTGGKHRSVVLSNELKKHFTKDRDVVVCLEHRDITKE